MGGKTVSERMDAVAFLDTGLQLGKIVDSLGVVNRYRTALSVGEQVNRRTMLFPIRAQLGQKPGRQDRVAVFSTLALLHPYHHPFTIDGADFEPDQFTDPQPRGVSRHQQTTVALF